MLSIAQDERITYLICQLQAVTFQHRFEHRFTVTLPDRFSGTHGQVFSLYDVRLSDDGSLLTFGAMTTLRYRPRWSRGNPIWQVYGLRGTLVCADGWAGTAEIRPVLVIPPQ